MKNNPSLKVMCLSTCFTLLFLLLSLSTTAQCPTITNPNPPPICDASGFMFTDLNAFADDSVSGNGIVWYDMPTGGTAFNTNQLVSEGTYYADGMSGACGVRESITIDFQVDDSGLNLDRVYCSNENATYQTYIDDVLQASIPLGGSVEIYTDIVLTTQAIPMNTIPNNIVNHFIVFVDSSGCKSQIENARIVVSNSPNDPTPNSIQEFCSDNTPTVADLDPGTTEIFFWYEDLDGSGNPVMPALSPTDLLVNETYYVQVDNFICVSNPVAVTVAIDDPADAGNSENLEYCNDNLPIADFDLFDELGGTPDSTGTWTGPLTTSNGFRGTVNISSLTTAGIYTFTYTITSTGACPDAVSSITIEVFETFTSGVPSAASPASFCESGLLTDLDLFSLLDNEDPDGQWTQGTSSTDPIVTSPFDLTGFTAGTYNFTYSQNLSPNPCPEESSTVQVIVLADPDAGIAVNQTFCENDLAANSPFNLFDALDGSQDNNSGIWTDASSTSISNSVDITGFTVAESPYLFIYTIDNGTCTDSEQISITIEDAPESGTPVATFPQFCEDSAPSSFNLFDLLEGEDQTGIWYIGTDTSGTTTTNLVDISSETSGTLNYTFDVDAIGSCDDPLVTVSIIINPLPDTGIPSSATFCENDVVANSPLDLFGQLTGEDSGGTWTDDDTSGALTGSEVDLTELTIGAFNFTYTITDANNCTNSSTVTITIEDAPESGTPVATFPQFCEGSAPSSFNLFDLLEGEDQTGIWYIGTDTSGTTTTNLVDISSETSGTLNYTFDVDAIGSCDDPLVTVSIIINPLPDTGIPSSATFCENDVVANSPLDLFGQLTGEDSGGTWTDDDTSGALTGSEVDLTELTIGAFNFTYTITDANNCTNSSTVTITIEDAPESGVANPPVDFCIADITPTQTYNLFDILEGEDQAGTWNDDDASGALSGSLVTIDGLTAGTYNFTYNVDAIGSCDDVDVTVSIVINDTPAPTADALQEYCDSATVADLVATGTTIQWYDTATGGAPLDATTALIDGEDYYATQTDANTNCESSVRTQVDVTIYQSPNAGVINTTPIVACNDNTSVDLFSGLDGTEDSGGTWNDDDTTGALSGNILDATGLTAGTYNFTYTVTASAPCVDDSTTIVITIEAPQSTGSDTTLDICSNGITTDLFTLLGTADTGGSWSPALTSGTGDFDPSTDASGTYTYTITNACGTVSSDVVVTVVEAPNAGTNTTLAACTIDATTDLFTLLGVNAQTGGTWSPTLNSGTGVFDPSVDTAGTYTYTVTANAPCTPDASAEVTITIDDSLPVIVLEPSPTFCMVDNPTVADLNNSIRATGTVNWYQDAALTLPLVITDALVDGEDYYATQTNNTGCESSVAEQVDVTINDAATPTLDDVSEEYCINDGPTLNTLSQNIVEYDTDLNNIIWYDVAIGGIPLSEDTVLNTTTYYAALIHQTTNCESSVRLEVTPDITACGKINLPDGFSPNGDGANDTYDIDNLGVLYPNFEIEIFNRNGNIVYKGNASTPRFDGTSNQGRVVVKGDLPVGVYFYIFRFNDGENKPEQGRLYLSR
ncbi:gliding motility-associated C-terminal domain-containing protein [Hyunsoonleella sp. 2307UL5-6]|uniref:gliding motility-associated C-terminal domain-containing protein n=1 Tax=Hyunsoonleella sp. 2307UL5-6 TaxID=3384768 RepID=UPI0039BD61E4